MARIERATSPLPRECSTTEPHGRIHPRDRHPPDSCTDPGLAGAGEGNRTLVISLEGFCSTIELHPPRFGSAWRLQRTTTSLLDAEKSGGGGWIRTNVGVSQQIYSLPPLATRAPLQGTANYGRRHADCQFPGRAGSGSLRFRRCYKLTAESGTSVRSRLTLERVLLSKSQDLVY